MYEIAKLIVAALAGGGLWQIVTWKIRKRKMETETAVSDYRKIEDIIDSYIDRMSKLSDEVVKLQEENMKLRQQLIVQLQLHEDVNSDKPAD